MIVFFLLMLIVMDLGRGIWYYIAVANAAREGSRQAIIRTRTDGEVKTWVIDKTPGLPLTASSVVVAPAAPRTAKTAVTVTVTYNFTPITPMMQALLSDGSLSLTSSSKMTVEQ